MWKWINLGLAVANFAAALLTDDCVTLNVLTGMACLTVFVFLSYAEEHAKERVAK